MKKGLNMQRKIMNGVIYALVMGMGTQSVAMAVTQSNTAPSTGQATAAPTAAPTGVNNTGGVNYNPGTANLDGKKDVVVPNPNLPNSMPSPTVQNVTPSQPAGGLPQDAQYSRGGTPDAVEATINILNTSNQKIRELNKDLYKKGKVINESPVPVAKSVNNMVVAYVSPGSVSPVIRVARNRTTTIIITDVSGQPWPITNYDGLSEEDFSVKRLDNPSPDGYVLSITPKGTFVTGNLALILNGLPTPLNIDVVSAQKEVDATTEIRVQKRGPNAPQQYSSIGLPDNLDNTLLSVLQGVAPAGSKVLNVSTNAVQAWLSSDGSMYVRTRYKVMAPAFEQRTSSPDGTFAYKMVAVPVVLYKGDEGRDGQFTVEGF